MDGFLELINALFSSSIWNSIVSQFQRFVAPFFVFGLVFIVLRFFIGFFKKEFNSFEDIFNFIGVRFVRFVMVLFFLLPVNAGDVISTGGLPTGLYIYQWGAKVAYETASAISNTAYGLTPFRLPSIFKSTIEKSTEKVESSLKSQWSNYNSDTMEVSYDELGGGSIVPVLGEGTPSQKRTLSLILTAILTVVGVAIGTIIAPGAGSALGLKLGAMSGILLSGAANGMSNAIAGIRDFFLDLLVPVSLIVAYYGSFFMVILQFLIFAPFFYFSTFYLFFDRGADVFYSNLKKWLGMLFYPAANVIAFSTVMEMYSVLKRIINDFLPEVLDPYLNFIQCLIIAVVLGGMFFTILVSLVKASTSFVDALLGSQSVLGYSGKR